MDILVKFVVVAIAVYGAASAIAVLKAGLPLRKFLEVRELSARHWLIKGFWAFWRSLIKCPPCLSFWIGVATSAFVVSIFRAWVADWVVAMVADGFLFCGTSWLLHLVAEKLGYGLDI